MTLLTKTFWIILVVAQVTLVLLMSKQPSWISRSGNYEIGFAALSIILVSMIFIHFLRISVQKGKTFNNYVLTGAYISSLVIARYLGEFVAFGGILGATLMPFFFVGSVIFSVVYGIKIFKHGR